MPSATFHALILDTVTLSAQTALAGLGIAFAFLLVLGAAVVYLRAGSMRGLRQVNEDLRAEIADKDRRLDDNDGKIEALERGMSDLKADNERKAQALVRIGEQAVGTADIRELALAVQQLASLSRDHDHEAAGRHAATIRALKTTTSVLGELKGAIESRHDAQESGAPE